MFGTGKSAEQRQKEKERKRRGARKYGGPKLKKSRKGTLSCISGAGAVLILAGCVLYALRHAEKRQELWEGSPLFPLCCRSGASAVQYRDFTRGGAVILPVRLGCR